MPGAFQKAFEKANADVKDLVGQVNTAVAAKDYSKAFAAIQTLSGLPGLSKDQQGIVGRAMLTVNNLLQSAAQTQGDTKAAETLKVYRVNK